ncbi:hypothetical protein BLA23254_07490 [Burkholderia lata]|uniref:Uncharacterized protein n=1 Tax=Burkholderia lata (strain ATCC 17760 / DSM 23089 / LMG 22485 / NCIMB 9086 / R18194 / 383) TaxID=482957 RepID=A0A6P2SMQ6_BURL3|nr:hypothetical protein BLA23254_07490 [Burkholderia lata]
MVDRPWVRCARANVTASADAPCARMRSVSLSACFAVSSGSDSMPSMFLPTPLTASPRFAHFSPTPRSASIFARRASARWRRASSNASVSAVIFDLRRALFVASANSCWSRWRVSIPAPTSWVRSSRMRETCLPCVAVRSETERCTRAKSSIIWRDGGPEARSAMRSSPTRSLAVLSSDAVFATPPRKSRNSPMRFCIFAMSSSSRRVARSESASPWLPVSIICRGFVMLSTMSNMTRSFVVLSIVDRFAHWAPARTRARSRQSISSARLKASITGGVQPNTVAMSAIGSSTRSGRPVGISRPSASKNRRRCLPAARGRRGRYRRRRLRSASAS